MAANRRGVKDAATTRLSSSGRMRGQSAMQSPTTMITLKRKAHNQHRQSPHQVIRHFVDGMQGAQVAGLGQSKQLLRTK